MTASDKNNRNAFLDTFQNGLYYFKKSIRNKLKDFYINKEEDGRLTVPTYSRFSPAYYSYFEDKPLLKKIDEHRPPFYIAVDKTKYSLINSGNNNTETEITYNGEKIKNSSRELIRINYTSENEYKQVYSTLSELDIKVLVFLATFRYVQLFQLYKEFPENGKRILKSLARLKDCCLVEEYEYRNNFETLTKDGQIPIEIGTSKCYSINLNGSTMLLHEGIMSNNVMYRWKEIIRYEDNFTPIRFWKIVDTYQNFRFQKGYDNYAPYQYLTPFKFTIERDEEELITERIGPIPEGTTEIQKKVYREKRQSAIRAINKRYTKNDSGRWFRVQHVKGFRFEGQIATKTAKGSTIKFDLYPFIDTLPNSSDNQNDLDRLRTPLLQYGQHFPKNRDEKNNCYRYLLIIVDNESVIKAIEEKYKILGFNNTGKAYNNTIAFFNLEDATTNDIQQSLKMLTINKDNKAHTISFTIDEELFVGQTNTNKVKS